MMFGGMGCSSRKEYQHINLRLYRGDPMPNAQPFAYQVNINFASRHIWGRQSGDTRGEAFIYTPAYADKYGRVHPPTSPQKLQWWVRGSLFAPLHSPSNTLYLGEKNWAFRMDGIGIQVGRSGKGFSSGLPFKWEVRFVNPGLANYMTVYG